MATYAVGDIQGCFDALQRLLAKAGFNPSVDRLWVAGDLVNRGPASLQTLRYLKSIEDALVVVLGNHDLHLLATSVGAKKLGRKDTIGEIISAPDSKALLEWLRRQPLLYRQNDYALSHAGVPHIWPLDYAESLSREVQEKLSSSGYKEFLHNMYGNEPDCWDDDLSDFSRLRVITNYFTRMRFLGADGRLELKAKEGADTAPEGTKAWFDYPRPAQDRPTCFLFGHWAALEGQTRQQNMIALDTGCVWGNSLTMLHLETGEKLSVPANVEL